MKKSLRALKLSAALGVAGALAFAAPAMAGTVGTTTVEFYSTPGGNSYSATSSDGTKIAYAFYTSNEIVILDVATNTATTVSAPPGSFAAPSQLAFSADNSELFVPNYTGNNVKVIDVASASVTGTMSSFDFGGATTANPTPDGQYLYVATYSGSLVKYDLANDTSSAVSVSSDVYASVMSPDGKTIWILSGNGTLKEYDTVTDSVTGSWSNVPTGNNFWNMCANSDASVMYLPNASAGYLYAVDLTDGLGTVLDSLALSAGIHSTCAVSPDDKHVYVTYYDLGSASPISPYVTEPGVVEEFTTSPLASSQTYNMPGVAKTEQVNFVDNCTAYVSGFFGNAQTLDFGPDCGPTPDPTIDPQTPSNELPNTGVDATPIAASAAFAIVAFAVGALMVVARRRKA